MEAVAYHCSNGSEFLVWSDGGGLDEKLVSALGIQRRIRLHGLQKDYANVSNILRPAARLQ